MRKPVSKTQMVFIVALWAILCFLVLTQNEHIDGPTILSLALASALVFIPIYKSLNRNK